MIRIAGFMVVLSLALACLLPARAAVAENGLWWKGLSRAEKLHVVEAEIDGLYDGWWWGTETMSGKDTIAVFNEMNNKNGGLKNENLKVRFLNDVYAAKKKQESAAPAFSKTFRYYIDSIDAFYANHPGAMNAPVAAIVECLSDRPFVTCDDLLKQAAQPSATPRG